MANFATRHGRGLCDSNGETTSVRDFVKMAFFELGISIEFKGEGVHEKGFVVSCNNLELGKQVISVDPSYFPPTEVDLLIGDPTKSKTKLGWIPKYNLTSMIKEMVQYDLNRIRKRQILRSIYYKTLILFVANRWSCCGN